MLDGRDPHRGPVGAAGRRSASAAIADNVRQRSKASRLYIDGPHALRGSPGQDALRPLPLAHELRILKAQIEIAGTENPHQTDDDQVDGYDVIQ
jgi:hypothetical protein